MTNHQPNSKDHELPASERLIAHFEEAWPVARWRLFNVLVAVSGGADSVGLLRTLAEIKRRNSDQTGEADQAKIVVAHFNHATRGAESDQDQAFVQQLAGELGLECVVGHRNDSSERTAGRECLGESPDDSLSEDSLRELRYSFLIDLARKQQARYIVFGHHAQDQIETILFRMARGTGLMGLAGIPFQRVVDESITVIRPMLNVDSALIRESLQQWKQAFRDDASNDSNDYARNFVRHEIVPAFMARFECTFETAVIRLGKQAAQQQAFLRSQVQPLLKHVVLAGEASAQIRCDELRECDIVLIRELLAEIWELQSWSKSQMSFEHYDRVAVLILDVEQTESGFHLPGKILCCKIDGRVVLSSD